MLPEGRVLKSIGRIRGTMIQAYCRGLLPITPSGRCPDAMVADVVWPSFRNSANVSSFSCRLARGAMATDTEEKVKLF
jgi:hypothetical protein